MSYTTQTFAQGHAFSIRRLVAFVVVVAPLAAGVVLFSRASGNVLALAFHSQLVEQGPAPTLFPGATTSYSIRFRNTGFVSWDRGTKSQVTLGVTGDPTELAQAKVGVGWLSADRVATTAELSVAPGAIGTFNFSVRAPGTPGVYKIPLRLVVDGVTWLEDDRVVVQLTSDLGFHSELVDQSRHPVLKPGELSGPITVHIRNAGARTWVRGTTGLQVNLGLAADDRSLAGLALGWPTPDRVAIQSESAVPPGGLATFVFRVRAPATPGTYALRLRPVADGVTWLEDDGIVTVVTVLAPGASLAQPASTTPATTLPSFTTKSAVDRASAATGSSITITATFTSVTASTAVLGVDVSAPGGATLVHQKWFDAQTFAAGEQRVYPVTWQIPATAALGAYSVNLRVLGADWTTLYLASDATATFSVVAAPVPPAATAGPAQTPDAVPFGVSERRPARPTAAPSARGTPGPTASAAPTITAAATAASGPTATAAPIVTSAPTAAPTASPAPAPAPSFTSSAVLSSSSAPAGGSIDLTDTVTSATGMSVLVDIEIWAPGGTSAFYQVWFDDQAFAAGQQQSYPASWQIPAGLAPGTYTVNLGVFAPQWRTTYTWGPAGVIAVTAAVPTAAPSPTAAPTSTVAPTVTPAPTIPPATGPIAEISTLLPASAVYADSDVNGARANARDGLWSTSWRTSEVAASTGAPHWIAYDLSTIPSASRQRERLHTLRRLRAPGERRRGRLPPR